MMELVASAGGAVSPPAPRRGRREKPWPPGKQKKLLRLYVCTQSERLPLVRILERLKDGSFDPRCATPPPPRPSPTYPPPRLLIDLAGSATRTST